MKPAARMAAATISIAAALTMGGGIAVADNANMSAYGSDLAAAGIPASAHEQMGMWSAWACDYATKSGMSDTAVSGAMAGDIAKRTGVQLTPGQASAAWASAKRNICGKSFPL